MGAREPALESTIQQRTNHGASEGKICRASAVKKLTPRVRESELTVRASGKTQKSFQKAARLLGFEKAPRIRRRL